MSDHKDGIDTGNSESLLGGSKASKGRSTVDPEIVPELPEEEEDNSELETNNRRLLAIQ